MTILARGLFLLALMLAGVGIDRHFFTGPKYEKLAAEHNRFKGGVEAAGRAQRDAAIVRQAKEAKEKKDADDKAKRRVAALDATVRQLRADAAQRNSSGGSASAAPAGSKCPDGQVCFDRAEYSRAVGEFDTEARRLADEGSKVTADLDSAAEWAQR